MLNGRSIYYLLWLGVEMFRSVILFLVYFESRKKFVWVLGLVEKFIVEDDVVLLRYSWLFWGRVLLI